MKRRYRREYDVKRRCLGKDAGDMMRERQLGDGLEFLLLLYGAGQDVLDDTQQQAILILVEDMLTQFMLMQVEGHIQLPVIPRGAPVFDDATIDALTGFSAADIDTMLHLLQFPALVEINAEDESRKYSIPGRRCFIFGLARLHSETLALINMEQQFHGHYSTLSKYFRAFIDIIHDEHCHRLSRLDWIARRLPYFNARIIASFGANEPFPMLAHRVALFTDGSRFDIDFPQGNDNVQALWYNGEYGHNAVAQFTIGPDGVIYDLFADTTGHNNDQGVLWQSELNVRLRACQDALQVPLAQQLGTYTDRGYTSFSHVFAAHRGGINLPNNLQQENRAMRPRRASNEWGIGKVKVRNPLLGYMHTTRIQQTPFLKIVKVAVLFTNLHTCLHESLTGLHYNCFAPSIEDYLDVNLVQL